MIVGERARRGKEAIQAEPQVPASQETSPGNEDDDLGKARRYGRF